MSKFRKKISKNLSLYMRTDFVPNVVLALGAVFFWRGTWGILDMYFFVEYPVISFIISIVIGLFLIYLPDGTLGQLGGYEDNKKNPTC